MQPFALMGNVSQDRTVMGSLTNPYPVSFAVPGFDYESYLKTYSPQPHDSKDRRIDPSTHNIIQRELPHPVRV